VATEPDLGDYFRMPRAASKARVAELAAAGELIPRGRGLELRRPTSGRPRAGPERSTPRAAVAVRFSDLVQNSRTERLFGFRYRIEIYTRPPSASTAITCCPSC